ncbi:cytochrome c [Mesorhizobium sp. YR577]|uniref:c-type cytochrome n=1 Tax=Mesorhizobium sp. YR577 TaxID=1884373 RepID=UPI0008E12ECE|nr:cytochrome c [Mesorhizobium sp. YR577]SFU23280.1 Cytochrome c [Mesorhizobium sp. YR577]
MTRIIVAVIVALATAAGVLAGYIFLFRNSPGLLEPYDAHIIARGEAVYVERCAACHGRNLEGQPDWQTPDKEGLMPAPPHDRNGHTWHHPDKLLFNITKLGVAKAANLKDYKTRMPAFGEVMSDDDIVAVLSYIKSRWPEELRKRHDELNRVYKNRERAAQ